jgi:hypothetical protein
MISEEDQGAKGGHRINKHESGSWDEELGAGSRSEGAEALGRRSQKPGLGMMQELKPKSMIHEPGAY